jgi:hypothetical protein
MREREGGGLSKGEKYSSGQSFEIQYLVVIASNDDRDESDSLVYLITLKHFWKPVF